MSEGPLKRSSGDETVDAALLELRREGKAVRPVELETTKGFRLGDTKFLMVTVTFNVVADTEVQVDNPLDYVPTIYLANLLDQRGNIYMDAFKAGVVDPCTWTEDTLGFKCTVDTSADALIVKVIIA